MTIHAGSGKYKIKTPAYCGGLIVYALIFFRYNPFSFASTVIV